MLYCPCGSNEKFIQCCQPIINGSKKVITPEQLMRSRYSAYATNQAQYIFDTYVQANQITQSVDDITTWAKQCKWVNLTVLDTSTKGDFSTVEFIACYIQNHSLYQLHELSRFIKENGNWRYQDGDIKKHQLMRKIKRNETCPCLSQKKFKQCCGLSP